MQLSQRGFLVEAQHDAEFAGVLVDQQVGIIRHVLNLLGRSSIPVGGSMASNPKHVSEFHRKWLGDVPPAKPDGLGPEVLAEAFSRRPEATLLTGAPLKNPGVMLESCPDVRIGSWVAQGGFAGDSVVPPEHRLEKFAGRETCPTFNFNGAPAFAKAMLASDRIGERWLVSKNVCHGVVYDAAFHARVGAIKPKTAGMRLVREGMQVYLASRSEGKAFHDPLAAAVALDRSVCGFREVEVYRERGDWGSRLKSGTGTRIAVSVDMERFFSILTES